MPNWCYNSVEFSGSKEDIRRIKSIVEKVEQGFEQGVFEKLIGRDESITDEQFKDGGWYDHNIDRYGTKWDVGKDGFDFYDESGTWSDDTAWSPPIDFWKICSEMYNLDVEMYWEEAGNDICGRCAIQNGDILEEENYEYQEGIYKLGSFSDWYEREWDAVGRFDLHEELEGEKPTRKGVLELLEKRYSFLESIERDELADEIMNELK